MFPLMEKPPYASLEGLHGLEDVPHREGFLRYTRLDAVPRCAGSLGFIAVRAPCALSLNFEVFSTESLRARVFNNIIGHA